LCQDQSLKLSPKARDRTAGASGESPCDNRENRAKVQHMEEGYTQLGTVLIDQRLAGSEEDGVIVVGRFKGDPYDGVQLSYDAGRRKLSGTSAICRLVRELGSIVLSSLIVLADRTGDRYRDKYGARCRDPND
jgi:hypothetical protein